MSAGGSPRPEEGRRPGAMGTRATVRLSPRFDGAEVLQVHQCHGDPVRNGELVMTLRLGTEQKRLRAPRDGVLMPLVAKGETLRHGDALFALHFEGDPDEPLLPPPLQALADAEESRRRSGTRAAGRAPAPPRKPAGPRHVRVLDDPPAGRPAAQKAASAPDGARTPLLDLACGAAAWASLAAGALFLLPVVAEFAYGGGLASRGATVLAAAAFGVLLWRLLVRGRGWAAQLAVAPAGALWLALMVVVLRGDGGPSDLGPLSLTLEPVHPLAVPAHVRASPAALPALTADPSLRAEGSAPPQAATARPATPSGAGLAGSAPRIARAGPVPVPAPARAPARSAPQAALPQPLRHESGPAAAALATARPPALSGPVHALAPAGREGLPAVVRPPVAAAPRLGAPALPYGVARVDAGAPGPTGLRPLRAVGRASRPLRPDTRPSAPPLPEATPDRAEALRTAGRHDAAGLSRGGVPTGAIPH